MKTKLIILGIILLIILGPTLIYLFPLLRSIELFTQTMCLFIVLFLILVVCLLVLKQSYISLTNDSKSSFWQILTNIFLVFFTFWMGIYVQDIIASKNEAINRKIVNFEYVDRITPYYKRIVHNNNDVISKLNIFYSLQKNLENDSSKYKKCEGSALQYLVEHKKDIVELSKVHDSIMADYKYYLDKEMFDSISNINFERNMLIAIIEFEDSTKLDSGFNSIIANILYEDDTLSYVKELAYLERIASSQYMQYSGKPCIRPETLSYIVELAKRGHEIGDCYNALTECENEILELGAQSVDSILPDSMKKEYYEAKSCFLIKLTEILLVDAQIMREEMEILRNPPQSSFKFDLSKLKNDKAIIAFLIVLILAFVVATIVVMFISPQTRKDKPTRNKVR